jgi:hypothetical protein
LDRRHGKSAGLLPASTGSKARYFIFGGVQRELKLLREIDVTID